MEVSDVVIIMSSKKEVIWGNANREQKQGNASERHKMTDLDETSGDNTHNSQKQAAQPQKRHDFVFH